VIEMSGVTHAQAYWQNLAHVYFLLSIHFM